MRELDNNTASIEDEGTIWFDENGAEEAVVKLLDTLEEDGHIQRAGEGASSFLDLGTGNGHMLFTLREGEDGEGEGAWEGVIVGVDYSPASVALARKIEKQRGLEPAVRFEEWDLLGAQPGDWVDTSVGFNVVLDKGTFDAISLMPQTEGEEHSCETYRRKVEPLLATGGFLVVTSCNWTKEELLSWFTPADGRLEFFADAKYPSFTFGGQTGQSIVTVAFRLKSE